MGYLSRSLDRLHQPEYTGENRCTPCTIVNVALTVVGSGLLAFVSPPLGGVALVGGLGLVYFRGYLVPYTPTLTKRYLPDSVLRRFDKHPAAQQPTHHVEDQHGSESENQVEDIDIERTLYSLGVITECDQVDDLCLHPEFERAWRDAIADISEKETMTADIRELLDLDADDEHVIEERGGQAAIVMIDGNLVGQWESDAALTADLAADRVLREWTNQWEQFHVVNRSELLNSLRMFIETCPECDAPVSVGQETVESCCRSFDVVAVACDQCGSRLFEIELTEEMRQQL